MKQVFALSFFLICAGYAMAQSPEATDTVEVNMLNHTIGERDTSRITFDRDVQRFFNRNLRIPMGGREFERGYATVTFVVDKEGKVTNPACPSMTNRSVGQEALRVTKKLSDTRIRPLYKDGIPVVAKVNINICFTTSDELSVKKEEIHSKAAIVVVVYP